MKKKKVAIKKRKIIIICLIIVVIAIIVNSRKINTSKEKVLIECGYLNSSFGFQYTGTVISSKGNIYEFKYDEKEKDEVEEISNLEEKSKSILKHKTKRKGKISNDDFEKIKQLAEETTENYEEQWAGNDMGSQYIDLYKYEDEKKINLKTEGDYKIKNKNSQANEILELLNNYKL